MSGGRFPHDTTVVMYGAPSPQEPTFPDMTPLVPFVPLIPNVGASPFVAPSLTPCAKCNRHIIYGTECPFCFRESEDVAAMRAENARLRSENETLRAENERMTKIAETMIDAIGRDAIRAALDATEPSK